MYPSFFPSNPPTIPPENRHCLGVYATPTVAVAEGCEASWAALSRCVPSGVPKGGPRQSPGRHCCSPGVHIHTGEVRRPCTYIYTHTVYKQSWHLRKWVCWSICKDSPQSSWADLTWRKRRLARRSLPPCSLIVNRHKQRKCDQTNSMRQNICLRQVNNQHIKKQKYQDNGLIDYYLKVHLCTFSNISAVKEKPSSTWVRKRSECLGMKLQ